MSDLAIYDLDRTVTRTPTYTPFLIHYMLRRAPWRIIFLPFILLTMLAYALRLIDRGRLKEVCQELMIGAQVHPRQLKPIIERFADKQIETNIRPGALKAMARDKAQGRRLVLATASYRIYADALAHRLGFDDVIGTESMFGVDDRVHAKILGENCFGAAKLRMIAEWVSESDLKGTHGHVRFYSDHASDEPTFEWADEPVAVNPHGKLRRLAKARGWAVENWG